MKNQQEHLDTLHEIRNIMDRSSRFISLSGLSGVAAGVVALTGAAIVKWYFGEHNINYNSKNSLSLTEEAVMFLLIVAALVLVAAIGAAIYFTLIRARKNNLRVWDTQSKRLVVNLAIPLVTGGLFCTILFYHGLLYMIAPSMLIFYGLALINGSKYTLGDIFYLGLGEVILGLISAFFIDYGLLIWTLGFGVLHIVYGSIMYIKYER